MPDINGCAIVLDRLFNDQNGAINAGAKAAWGRNQKAEGWFCLTHLNFAPTRLLAAGKAASYTAPLYL